MSLAEAPPKHDREAVQAAEADVAWQTVDVPAGVPSLEAIPPISLPPSWPVSRDHPPRRSWAAATLVGLLALLLIAGGALAISSLSRSSAPAGAPAALQQVGTLFSIRTMRSGAIQVRTVGGNIASVAVTGTQLLTRDGQSLTLSDLRPGDSVRMRSRTVLVDVSQNRASVQGNVAISPGPDGDVMTVQLTPTRTILVDIGARTRINGQLPSVGSRMSIEEADQVRVAGILDKTMDEMTQTGTIDRIGPSRTSSSAAGSPMTRSSVPTL